MRVNLVRTPEMGKYSADDVSAESFVLRHSDIDGALTLPVKDIPQIRAVLDAVEMYLEPK